MIISLFRWITRKNTEEDKINLRMTGIILFASLFTFILALGIDRFESYITTKVVSGLFLVTAITLLASRFLRGKFDCKGLNLKFGALTGIAQGLAVLPGLSRSGLTISASLLGGMDRKDAGEYSFLLSIPAIIGALVFDLRKLDQLSGSMNIWVILVGVISAFIFGMISLLILLRLVRKGRLYLFSIYLIPLGIVGLIFL
jgi:undecaprenyl-diphosphatase